MMEVLKKSELQDANSWHLNHFEINIGDCLNSELHTLT